MPKPTTTQFDILFRYHSDVMRGEITETIKATPVDSEKHLYRLDSIPHFGPMVCLGDIVFAEIDEIEGVLTYKTTEAYSGNSTIQVAVLDESASVEELQGMFAALGCKSEVINSKFFVISIPGEMPYQAIQRLLDKMEDAGVIAYAEPCLSDEHGLSAA